ncbi:phytanoyl-CoA dioxygenase [Aureococcus anophagefferens]|nr:phytanoyl-CoA dioxygenase [Aureococcus anophagefferens]
MAGRSLILCALIALAAGATHTQTIAIDGLVVDATWETGTDPNLIWAPVDAFLEIPADEPTRRLAAAHFCDEAKWEDDACEATVAAALAAAAAAGERFQVAHFGSFPLERVSEDHWGNPLDYDGDAALTAAFRRGTDFASRCAAPRRGHAGRPPRSPPRRSPLLDAAHLAKFQRDLAGTTVFVATHARFEAAARDLTAPERIVAADPAILEAELSARGVAQVARSRATYAPGEAAQAARDAEHNNTEVHGGFWQWALLDLALDAFWEDLAAFDVVVRTRADLDEHVPFPYADLRAAPGAIHCRSDFVFYGGPAEFSRAFDGARDRAEATFRPPRAPDGSPLYEPVDWDLVLASDLTGLKWWWLPLPVAVFGAGGAGPGVDAPPRTPVELKSAARDHLDALRRLPRGAGAPRRRRPALRTDYIEAFNSELFVAFLVFGAGLRACAPPAILRNSQATELSTRRFPYVRDATDDPTSPAGSRRGPRGGRTISGAPATPPSTARRGRGAASVADGRNCRRLRRGKRHGLARAAATASRSGSPSTTTSSRHPENRRAARSPRRPPPPPRPRAAAGAGCGDGDGGCVEAAVLRALLDANASAPPTPPRGRAPTPATPRACAPRSRRTATPSSAARRRRRRSRTSPRTSGTFEARAPVARTRPASLRRISEPRGALRVAGLAHSDALWSARSATRVRDAYASYGDDDLVTSFDGASALLSETARRPRPLAGSFLHTDGNADERAIQGMLLLTDQTAATGGFMAIRGSHAVHDALVDRHGDVNGGSWLMPVPNGDDALRGLDRVLVEADAGDLVLWDSRLATRSTRPAAARRSPWDKAAVSRLSVFACMAPAAAATVADLERRLDAARRGAATGHWPVGGRAVAPGLHGYAGYDRAPPRAFSRVELELVVGRARARELLLSRRLYL